MSSESDTAALTLALEDPDHPDARRLIERLSAEIGRLYGDDGSGAFAPGDVRVPGGAFVVARLGTRPIGCGALRPLAEGVGEVKRMYTEPEMRGRGIGRRILAELEAQARAQGYRCVRLETGLLQPEAVRLYEAAGYHRIPCFGHHKDDPRSVCFEKSLV